MPAGPQDFVDWFRAVSPYVHNHRGRTFVICFGGEMVLDRGFPSLIHDIALLNSLGIRQVLVYGTRPQIEARLKSAGADIHYVNGLRVTDEQALTYVKEAAGTVRIEIEALLSLGLPNSPMANASIRVASGNFITAKPSGVRNGTDLRYTGEVRRVDAKAIHAQLNQGDIVVIPPVGYSPTGEVFNLDADEVATAVAISLRASKLIFMLAAPGVLDGSGTLVRQLSDHEAQQFLIERRSAGDDLSEIECAIRASRNGVGRARARACAQATGGTSDPRSGRPRRRVRHRARRQARLHTHRAPHARLHRDLELQASTGRALCVSHGLGRIAACTSSTSHRKAKTGAPRRWRSSSSKRCAQ